MPNSIRPGDVLADRYLLVDLLSESGNGRFWRAQDRILERHVAVHVVSATDPNSEAMMAAARSSAAVHERRILRVLDVDQRDDLCYVVNEWGSGSSFDIVVAGEGPLGARRAAWLVSEVAAAIGTAHEAGVAHGRLVPENVLIDESGSVRIIGFAVDAALLGMPSGRMSSDLTDLAGLLYFLLTGTWPGVSRSGVPSAPHDNGRVLRPRQVKAGVPRPLDLLCGQLINSSDADLDARGIEQVLTDFVGDASGMAAIEAAHLAGRSSGADTDHRTRAMPRPAAPAAPIPAAEQVPEEAGPAPEAEPDVASPPDSSRPTDLPTQAGLPIFDDVTDDVSWLQARAEKPAPPPPFDEPPERPLFAPAPVDGEPVRRSRPGNTPGRPQEYWPWDTGAVGNSTSGVLPVISDDDEDDEDVPGRSWLRLALIVGLCATLLVAIVFAFNLGRGGSPLGDLPGGEDSSESNPTTKSSTRPIEADSVDDFDPQGDPNEESSELVPLAVDGDPTTAWRTVTYTDQLGPAGLKTGVGLLLDLGEVVEVAQVDLTLLGAPTGVSIYVSESAPTGVRDLTPAAELDAKARQRIALDEPTTGRYVVVWLTSLPAVSTGGFRGQVAEVVVRG